MLEQTTEASAVKRLFIDASDSRYVSAKEKVMVRLLKQAMVLLVTMAVVAGLALAQHTHAAMTEGVQGQQSTSEDMMKSCQKHGSETMAALDKLEKTIASGRESSDPLKMKAALDQAQKELAEAKHHMSMCPMMSGGMMHHGNMDHMQHNKSTGQQSTPDNTKAPE